MPVYSPAFTGTLYAYPRRDGQAELTSVAGCMPRWFICLQTVTHIYILLGRPNVSSEGLMFYCRCFLFVSPRDLRAASADRRKTLPHDRNLVPSYNASPKIRGAFPPKKLGAKNMQNSERFQTTSDFDREYLWNGTRYPKSERNLFTTDSSRVPRRTSGELWSTNKKSYRR